MSMYGFERFVGLSAYWGALSGLFITSVRSDAGGGSVKSSESGVLMALSVLVGLALGVVFVFVYFFSIGFIATLFLVHLFGIAFAAFFAVFPAAFAYLVFWDRLFKFLMLLRLRLSSQKNKPSEMLVAAMFLGSTVGVLAAYFLTRYGIVVAGNYIGADVPGYQDLKTTRDYLSAFLEPGNVTSLVVGLPSFYVMLSGMAGRKPDPGSEKT